MIQAVLDGLLPAYALLLVVVKQDLGVVGPVWVFAKVFFGVTSCNLSQVVRIAPLSASTRFLLVMTAMASDGAEKPPGPTCVVPEAAAGRF